MAITGTTLAGAVTSDALVLVVTSATGFAAGNFVKIDGEYMTIDRSYVSGTNIPVFRRGDNGSAQVAHAALAITTTGLWSDLAANPSANITPTAQIRNVDHVTYSVNGAITVPVKDTTVVLNKAGVAAMTLGAPAKDQDGLTLEIVSNSANAHTVTATGLLNTGTATVNLATFAAFKGASVRLKAIQGLWAVLANTAVTLT